ncbi:MAG: serine/threonine-protein kinase [Planctomycetota bacterium JB042]
MIEEWTEAPPRCDGFERLSPLGRGGMGVVYRAFEPALQRWVALKMLPAEGVDTPEARASFHAEAQRLARIAHPNIVPIHTFGESEGRPFFTMTYVEGETLQASLRAAAVGDTTKTSGWFRRGDEAAARRANLASCVVARALSGALEHLHGAGVVHRDLKPANVLLDPVGRPILVDLGVAAEAGGAPVDDGLVPPGTVRFMAPELLRPEGARSGPTADVYALGLVLFEMLTLRPAFAQEELGALVDAVRSGDKPTLREVDPDAPAALDAIVERATAVDAGARFADAGEMSHALLRATGDLGDASEITHLVLGDEITRALAPEGRVRGRLRAWLPFGASLALGVAIGASGLPRSDAPVQAPPASAPPHRAANSPRAEPEPTDSSPDSPRPLARLESPSDAMRPAFDRGLRLR